MTSYHDLHVTTASIPRTRLFDLPYGYEVMCNRVAGWGLWLRASSGLSNWTCVASEYAAEDEWLILDVDGSEIVNSRDRSAAE